ncbi:CRISPR-associated RAMP protein, Cmr4 family [Syntrophobotulus glycolicus DSM 8271]|uniref:CRISPR-associated RAMP protein, Cmr4 family n=1 Tax=Syntrophobotulus glycolicus (strain DSM 8271 / FlGlyR) TaxID=645991 RepID=F0SV84_SYNGF|nr:type III-B CRISPR module RAMP protein Cmr4 [Syntrophobotulus glycolicus]ADY55584.1 CRISPR-associated RAMP protein, Cmr4 family [Syntrophobotulus glycolicus DSM 8271]
MYKITKAMFLSVLTPLHAGGGTELSMIDQPIQREVHTGFPKIEASSLKGSIRSAAENGANQDISEDSITQIFGADDKDNIVASAVAFSDARLLFFPVRSAKGVFAFVTCPMVLQRFFNDMKLVGIGDCGWDLNLDKTPWVIEGSSLLFKDVSGSDTVMLEEFLYNVLVEKGKEVPFATFIDKLLPCLPENELTNDMLKSNAILVPNEDFADFVKLSTEVITRIKINNKSGIVEPGALFNEEYLPTESILYSLIFVADSRRPQNENTALEKSRKEAAQIAGELEKCIPSIFQIGANMTLGKGFVACKIVSGGEAHA